MEAPTIGGMRVRKGDGETVRLARGASLTDFAEQDRRRRRPRWCRCCSASARW